MTSSSAAVAAAPSAALARSAPPAWPQAIGRAIARLPVPFLGYAAIAVVTTLGLELRMWVSGRLPVGTLDTNSVTFGISLPVTLYVLHYIERAAASAFARFRPALTPDADAAAIERQLAILPARAGLFALLASILLTAFRYYFDPGSSQVEGLPLWTALVAFVLETLNVGCLFALITLLVRQMLAIRRVLADRTIVDIYRPGPLHALSGLSARMGIALVLMVGAITALVTPGAPEDPALGLVALLPFVVAPTVIAILTFLVPLYGTHGRLVEEKERLQAATDIRLQGLVNEINGLIDGRRLGEVDPLNKALGAVIQQRDFVNRLSTWPWSTGTARALVTAILLPIGLFVAQRIVSAGLGLH